MWGRQVGRQVHMWWLTHRPLASAVLVVEGLAGGFPCRFEMPVPCISPAQDLLNIARTTLSSKILTTDKDHFAQLAVVSAGGWAGLGW